jgi:hypothetical protein
MLKAIEARISAAASRYEDAHKSLVVLAPILKETGWRTTLRPLNRQDLRAMSDLLDGESEGTQRLSWIWTTRGAADKDGDEGGATEGI